MEKISDKKNIIITFSFYMILGFITYLIIKYAISYIFPFILGFLFSMSIKDISVMLGKKLNMKPKYISFFLLILFYIAFFTAVYFLGSKIITEIEEIIRKLPELFNLYVKPTVNGIVERLSENSELHEYVSSILNSAYEGLSSLMITGAGSFLTSLPNILLFTVFTVISSFFFSADYYSVTTYISKLIPQEYRQGLFIIKSIFTGTVLKMIKGYGLIMLITFSELFLGLILLRVEDALVISALVAVLDILPIIGSGTFLIPASIISIIGGRYYLGIGLLLLFLIITVIRNIIEPKIIGNNIGLHPILMLLSIYIGGKVFGFAGIIVLPIVITVIKEYMKNKNTISV